MRLLRHLLPRASKLLGSLASWLCAGLLELKSPLRRAFFMAKGQGCDETGVRFELIEIGVRFQLIHALAARHGDSFFWSFAQKMVPRPCGFTVIFA
jgi:hypothetical protein